MKGWTEDAVQRANSPQLARSGARTPPAPTPTPPNQKREPISEETPKPEIPVLPEPIEPGRWLFGRYDIRYTNRLAPNARVVIICPDSEWPALLKHLALLKP